MNTRLRKVFADREKDFRLRKEIRKKLLNRLTVARLLTFIGGIILLYFLFKLSQPLGFAIFVVLAGLFFYLVKKSSETKREIKKLGFLENINHDEIKRLNYDLEDFDPGNEFIDQNHYYSYDLDIFGAYSIFQYINRTISWSGREALARWLTTTFSKESILLRQEAVKEMIDDLEFRQSFQAEGMFVNDKEDDYTGIQEWLQQPNSFKKAGMLKWLIRVLPVVTLGFWVAAGFGISWLPAVSLSLLQLFITGLFLRTINKIHSTTSSGIKVIQQVEGLLKLIYARNFSSEKLAGIRARLGKNEDGALAKIDKLAQQINLLDNRLNMLAAIFLNGLLLWDLRLALRLEKWKEENRGLWPVWIHILGKFDAVQSLSAYAYINPGFVFPEIKESLPIETKQAGHLLIPVENRVCNDFRIDKTGDVMLITGSNMSGKSTFLRAVGTNMVLTYAGGPVCADSFSTPIIQLFTSMRILDDLSRQESTFYAELKRLRLMLELEEEMELFILLDEILKGTNSQDKFTGSRALLKQLLGSKSISIVATHDLALSELEKTYPKKLHNYSFEVEISKGRFHFDYKLKKGVCSIMNASELMKQMGIKL